MIYLDEAGIDAHASYPYGWSLKGRRCYARKSGQRGGRTNFIAGLTGNTLIAPFVFDGYCNKTVFETYIEHCLLPVLQEGDVVILDNASFHQSTTIKDFVEWKKAELLYLPPYSPDLNPIEHYWFAIKNHIRQQLDEGRPVHAAIDQAFLLYV